jgi:hypothetical protein
MKKIVVILASIVMSVVAIQPVQAQDQKVLAIIDTAIDSSRIPNVIHEVCFTYNNTCNNKAGYDEGPGSARINDWKIKGALHGFSMAQVAVQADPNVKIVFIRISDEKVYDTFSMIRNDGGSIARAIDWVSNNASRFNIKAVSISQSRSNFAAGTCPSDALFESSVKKLKLQNVPTFVATGNDSKKNQIGFPACVSGVYSVASTDANNNVVKSSNINATTSLLASTCFSFNKQACVETKDYFGVMRPVAGTSTATVLAATLAISKNNLSSFDQFLATLPKSGNYPYLSK